MVRPGIAALLAILPVLVPAQTTHGRSPVRFKTAVDVVQLNVSVTDGNHRYVTGLGERDFAVFEDGRRQAVSFFSDTGAPLSLALLIDGSASMDQNLPFAQDAAVRFVGAMGPRDLARVTQFNERVTVLQDFTSDQGALEGAIRRTQAAGATALYTALYVTLREMRAPDHAAEARRRAVVLLSDGEDTGSAVGEDQVLELARRADVTIYPIALRSRSRATVVPGPTAHFLARLARDTGGEVHYPTALTDLKGVYSRIADDLRTQYTLGYVSANPVRDGSWRQISVRTPSRDNLFIRYRLGYYAPRG
ncbi:MAG TPA: VWA domain-containing protein, partial [Vicinamibacteria bacterium]|nr:VWA domain-containing protein [Vicinamibacteria bacterium]